MISKQSQNRTIRILLVDDHFGTRHETRRLLAAEGEEMVVVGESENGEDAVLKAEKLRPDVILMDIFLPGISGIEATRMILKESPSIRVIFLSSHSGTQILHSLKTSGGVGLVRKENACEELISTIRSTLQCKRPLP